MPVRRHTGPLPETIGPYLVVEKIGAGGMATVYRARRPDDGREVALKVLAIHLADQPPSQERFRREARLLLQFNHPHILPVFDIGEDGGTPYLVMPLLSGRSLADLLTGEPLPRQLMCRFTRQIASALDYAHARGVIHRDIKPANILLDDDDQPVLADFGVAYAAGADQAARLTSTGAFVGTAAYASPEQSRGEELGRPSDIYSLGVMVYEMGTGQLPFQANSAYALLKMHMNAPLPNPLALNADLPVGFYTVISKALAKLPKHRYPSAMKFSQAMDEAFRISPRPQPPDEEDWLIDDPAFVIASSGSPGAAEAEAPPVATADDPGSRPGDRLVSAERVADRLASGPLNETFDDTFRLDPEIDVVDDLPGDDDVLSAERPRSIPAPEPVIRPLQPRSPREGEPVRDDARRRRRWGRWLLGIGLVGAVAAGLVLVLGPDADHGSESSPDASISIPALGIALDYPAAWQVASGDVAVIPGAMAPAAILADRLVEPGGPYDEATLAVAVQHMDPVIVFGVPTICQPRLVNGPASTFACMARAGHAVPVSEPFESGHFEGVRLPGTLPPSPASLPIVLLGTGQSAWLAVIIVHWDGYADGHGTLDRIARSIRPL